MCEVAYGRVQGRSKLIEHFRSAKFPGEDADFCPLVYIDPAAPPLTIHRYLEQQEGREQDGQEAGA